MHTLGLPAFPRAVSDCSRAVASPFKIVDSSSIRLKRMFRYWQRLTIFAFDPQQYVQTLKRSSGSSGTHRTNDQFKIKYQKKECSSVFCSSAFLALLSWAALEEP